MTCDWCVAGVNVCWNGECVEPCEPGSPFGCASQGSCEGRRCVPDVLPTCDEQPCNRDQACISTYCVATSTDACDADAPNCGSERTCDLRAGRCIGAPTGDADRTCRIGDRGAVCNVTVGGITHLAGWAELHVCLIGRCTTDAHCPAPLTCRETASQPNGLGFCR